MHEIKFNDQSYRLTIGQNVASFKYSLHGPISPTSPRNAPIHTIAQPIPHQLDKISDVQNDWAFDIDGWNVQQVGGKNVVFYSIVVLKKGKLPNRPQQDTNYDSERGSFVSSSSSSSNNNSNNTKIKSSLPPTSGSSKKPNLSLPPPQSSAPQRRGSKELQGLPPGAEACRIDRRFSEFYALYNTLRSMYGGSHLKANIPPPPSKTLGDISHLEEDKIEDRKEGLRMFLKKLETFPGVMDVPNIEHFFGMDSV